MTTNETRRSILESLGDGPVSGPQLADSLDVSRAAVWKQVDALRDAGFEIESGPGGYELTDVTAYNAPAVVYGLVFTAPITGSTTKFIRSPIAKIPTTG
mgnify:CR=1 FL=1